MCLSVPPIAKQPAVGEEGLAAAPDVPRRVDAVAGPGVRVEDVRDAAVRVLLDEHQPAGGQEDRVDGDDRNAAGGAPAPHLGGITEGHRAPGRGPPLRREPEPGAPPGDRPLPADAGPHAGVLGGVRAPEDACLDPAEPGFGAQRGRR